MDCAATALCALLILLLPRSTFYFSGNVQGINLMYSGGTRQKLQALIKQWDDPEFGVSVATGCVNSEHWHAP